MHIYHTGGTMRYAFMGLTLVFLVGALAQVGAAQCPDVTNQYVTCEWGACKRQVRLKVCIGVFNQSRSCAEGEGFPVLCCGAEIPQAAVYTCGVVPTLPVNAEIRDLFQAVGRKRVYHPSCNGGYRRLRT